MADYDTLYREIQQIGRGSYGYAMLVESKQTKQKFIAKKIPIEMLTTKEMEAAFQEAEILKSLQHHNIVSYQHSFVHKGTLVIVMEYCGRGDISIYVKKAKEKEMHLEEDIIMNWFSQMCLGLDYVHKKRILHRDLKTSNIFVTEDQCVKIGDFGISKVLQNTFDEAMSVVGTPFYMSPEICQNKPYTIKSDVWALGCILYEMCTLNHPFNSSNLLSLVYQIVQEEPKPIPDYYSKDLVNLLKLLLTKDPDQRPSVAYILSTPFLRKHMEGFINNYNNQLQEDRGEATIKANSNIVMPPHKELSAKERLKLKKEMEIKKREEELKNAAKNQLLNNVDTKSKKLGQIYSQSSCMYQSNSPNKHEEYSPYKMQAKYDTAYHASNENTQEIEETKEMQNTIKEVTKPIALPQSKVSRKPIISKTANNFNYDNREIKSSGKYVLPEDEYEDDFVSV